MGRSTGVGGSAGYHGFQRSAVGDAAAHLVDHLLEVVAHGQLVDPGLGHIAAETEEAGAAVALGADLGVLRSTDAEDVGHGGQCFGIVNDGGAAIQAHDRGERRPDAGNAALAFKRFHQGRLFAHFVSAGAGMGDNVEIQVAAEDVLAQKALGIGVVDGFLHDLEQVAILAAQVDEAHFGADGQPGDDDALDHRVGIVLKDQAVFAGARLALISVDQDVFRFRGLLGDKGPLHPGREAGAPAAAQVRGFHLRDDAFRAQFDGLAGGSVTIQLEVLVDRRSRPCRSGTRSPSLHLDGRRDRPWFSPRA